MPGAKDNVTSNMVVLEAALPSGYTTEKDSLYKLLRQDGVKLLETKNSETVAIVYIERMISNSELCLSIDGYRVHKVAEQKPVAVKVFDYYDSCE